MNPAPAMFWQLSKAVLILALFCKFTEVVRAWVVSGWVWSSAGCSLGWAGKNCWWIYSINKTGPFYIMRDFQRMKKFCLLAWVSSVHKPPGWLLFVGSVISKLCQMSRTLEKTFEIFNRAQQRARVLRQCHGSRQFCQSLLWRATWSAQTHGPPGQDRLGHVLPVANLGQGRCLVCKCLPEFHFFSTQQLYLPGPD